MDEVTRILPLVERLSEIRLTVPFLSKVCKETGLPEGEWGIILKDLGSAKTAWDLLQSITGRLTHHGRGRSGVSGPSRYCRLGDIQIRALEKGA